MAMQDPGYVNWYFDRLKNCLSPSFLPDVTLASGDIQFDCHKIILSTASDYFMKVFTSSDGLQGNGAILKLNWIGSTNLTNIITYIYSAKVEISNENVRDLIKAADKLNLVPLLALCDAFMARAIPPTEAGELYHFAKTHQLAELKTAAWGSILQNATQLLRGNELCKLSFEELHQLLSDDQVKSEPVDLLFEAVCRWVLVDKSERHSLMPQLLKAVPLHLCDKEYLLYKVMYHDLMVTEECRGFVQHAIAHNMMAATAPAAATMDGPSLSLVAVGGAADGELTRDVRYLVEEDNSWPLLTQTPQVLVRSSAVGIPGGLMLTGGRSRVSANPTRDCHMFDTAGSEWRAVSPMRHGRSGHGCVYHSGQVFVAGGERVSGCRLSSVEVYDMATVKWTAAPDMPHPSVYYPTRAYSCGHKLCVLSGNKPMQVYDGTWQTINLPPKVTFATCGAAVEDMLYLIMRDGTFYSCNVHTQAWTALTPPQYVHNYGSAIEREGKIVVLGGHTDLVEEYSVTDDSWRTISQLPYKTYMRLSLVTIDTGLLGAIAQ